MEVPILSQRSFRPFYMSTHRHVTFLPRELHDTVFFVYDTQDTIKWVGEIAGRTLLPLLS